MPLPYNKGTIDSAPQKSKKEPPGWAAPPLPASADRDFF